MPESNLQTTHYRFAGAPAAAGTARCKRTELDLSTRVLRQEEGAEEGGGDNGSAAVLVMVQANALGCSETRIPPYAYANVFYNQCMVIL